VIRDTDPRTERAWAWALTEATACTCTVHANLGPRVPGPQFPGPGSSGPGSLVPGSTEYSVPYFLAMYENKTLTD